MRVLHVIEGLSPSLGGLSQSVVNLSAALQSIGVDVSIITTTSPANGGMLQPQGVEVQAFQRKILNGWGYAPRLSQAVERSVRNADLVHLHGLWGYPHYVASRAAISAGKPYLVCPHGMLDTWALNQRRLKKRLYFRLIESRTLRRASSIHAVSETEVEDIRRLAISTEVVSVPNGINQTEFEHLPDRNIFREKHPALAKKTIVLFLGRVHPKKGIALLAKAFSDLAGVQPDLALVVVGPDSGGCQREMEDCINASGAPGSYVFTGLLGREECIEALAAADIFVLPSSSEGLPIAAMEALAAGLPVILTKACNLQGVEENGAGMIIEQDADALRQAIVTLAGDQAMRKEMGRKGREFVLTNYTWDRMAARMVDVYESILNKHKPVLA